MEGQAHVQPTFEACRVMVDPALIVQQYLDHHYRIVCWPALGDSKGPKEKGWPEKTYTFADYHLGHRVGLLTGIEIASGQFLHDVDLDWAPGSAIAQALLPPTGFVFGRASKRVSHCFYTTPEPIPSFRYEDIDKSCLIELRGTKLNGEIGLQTMAPPSIWTKDGVREPLTFVRADGPDFIDSASKLKQRVCLAAIGMLLAKHLGRNGFGHEQKLAWAGFLLRAGLLEADLVAMGEAISPYTNNTNIADVRLAVASTAKRLTDEKHRTKGGPALARLLGDHGKAIIARINEWLGRDSDFIRNAKGLIIAESQENIRRAVMLFGHELSFNEFSAKKLIDKQPLEDRELNELWLRIDEEHRFRPSFAFFEKVIGRLAWSNPFHPVRDYLNALTWDGVPRLEHWLIDAAGAEESAYLRAVSAIVLLAAVRRIRDPGCKYDEMIVLESSQGLNKSSALRALCPRGEWFSDDLQLNLTSQKLIEATLGKWIIEASDLAGRRKAEVEQLKSMLSRQVDGPARMAYAHLAVERPRQFVIIGTTNSTAYLNDPTGARRFWPVKVSAFNVSALIAIREQLWAEAAAREAAGESIRLSEELWPEAAQHQEERREIDPWETVIQATVATLKPSTGWRRIATSVLWQVLNIDVVRRDRYGALRIADIMQRLGYQRTRVRTEEGIEVGYASPVGAEEVAVEEARPAGHEEAPF